MTGAAVAQLVRERTGIVLPDKKADALVEQVRAHYPALTLGQALERLRAGPGLPSWVVSSATINETFFFRHPEQFDFLGDWIGRTPRRGKLGALCLGCSTGEEPYSLAMLLADAVGLASFAVTAIDVDPKAIETAKLGQYTPTALGRTAMTHRDRVKRYMSTSRRGRDVVYAVAPEIRSAVRFVVGNLLTIPLARYDIVFARNVLIYLSADDRCKVLQRLRAAMQPGGMLIIGAGELLPRELSFGAGPHSWCVQHEAA